MNKPVQRYALSLLLPFLLLICCGSKASPQANPSQAESFKPGASISLKAKLLAPGGWHFNPMLPISLNFDKEYLKDAPFTLSKESFSFTLKDSPEVFTASLPLSLRSAAADGDYIVPIHLSCSVCDKSGSSCVMVSEEMEFHLAVSGGAKSPAGKSKGVITFQHAIAPPD